MTMVATKHVQASGHVPYSGTFAAVTRIARRSTLHPLDHAVGLAVALTTPVWGVSDNATAVREALDEVWNAPTWAHTVGLLIDATPTEALEFADAPALDAFREWAAGLHPLGERCVELTTLCARLPIAEILEAAEDLPGGQAGLITARLAAVRGPFTPARFRAGLRDQLRAEVAFYALAATVVDPGIERTPFLVEALVRAWHAGALDALAFAALLTDDPEIHAAVPDALRIDLNALTREEFELKRRWRERVHEQPVAEHGQDALRRFPELFRKLAE